MVTFEDLDRLKQALHPAAQMDVVEQCRIVAESLSETGPFPNNIFKVAEYLGISRNKVYKMNVINKNCIDELKEWLKSTHYQSDKAYRLSTLTFEDQLAFTKLTDGDKMLFFKAMTEMDKAEPEEAAVEPEVSTTEPKKVS